MTLSLFQEDMSDSAKVRSAKGPKLSKPFPEEAMPDFIRLLHANSHNKQFLTKEFGEFWRRQAAGEGGETPAGGGPDTPTAHAGQLIAKRKILDKIQAGGQGHNSVIFCVLYRGSQRDVVYLG